MSNKTPPAEAKMVPVEPNLTELVGPLERIAETHKEILGPVDYELLMLAALAMKCVAKIVAAPDQGDGSREGDTALLDEVRQAINAAICHPNGSGMREPVFTLLSEAGMKLNRVLAARKDAPEQAGQLRLCE